MSPTLAQLAASEGFELVLFDAVPGWRYEVVGWDRAELDRAEAEAGQLLGAVGLLGDRIAVLSHDWDHAYSVAHEIAEHRHGYQHSAEMFCEQANVMARWIKYLATEVTWLQRRNADGSLKCTEP